MKIDCLIQTSQDHLLGFMFKVNSNYGLLFRNIEPNSLIHMLFVFCKLDIIFLDDQNKVVKIKRAYPFITFLLPPKGTVHMLELPANNYNVKKGDYLSLFIK